MNCFLQLKESCVFTPSASRSAAMYSVPNDTSDGKSASSVHQTMTVTYESTNQQQTQLSGSSGDATAGGIERTSFPSMPSSQAKAAVTGQDSLNQQLVHAETYVFLCNLLVFGAIYPTYKQTYTLCLTIIIIRAAEIND